jgi:ribosomal protein S25
VQQGVPSCLVLGGTIRTANADILDERAARTSELDSRAAPEVLGEVNPTSCVEVFEIADRVRVQITPRLRPVRKRRDQ